MKRVLFLPLLFMVVTISQAQTGDTIESGERSILLEAPSSPHKSGAAATGLVFRVANNPSSGDPIFQIRSEWENVRFFVEQSGYTGSISNSAWFGGGKDNYFKSNVGIGTENPTAKLTVNGTVKAEEIIVEENIGADFVFADNYKIPTLSEVEQHIKSKKHLPEIPSAQEMIAKGVKVGELQMKLLQKIEELTLYIIEQDKKYNKMKKHFEDELEKFRQLKN